MVLFNCGFLFLQLVIQIWMLVQKKWMYLEGIFLSSEDIKMQLPEASKSFEKIDIQFKKIMTTTTKQPV